MKKIKIIFGLFLFSFQNLLAFSESIVKLDYDVTYYQLAVTISPQTKSIRGSNLMQFKARVRLDSIQIKLTTNLFIDSILSAGKNLQFARILDEVIIELPETIEKGNASQIQIFYHGIPHVASNPPWEGGFVWSKDSLDYDWIGVACEGEGASLWWPCKDESSDEPDSMRIMVTCPKELCGVSNGVLEKVESKGDVSTFHWMIHYPINHYNVTINLAKYVHFSDTLVRKDQTKLPLDFYVLNYNIKKAQLHFQQVKEILNGFESFLGNYPFPKDGYALVETPYWGMEHQSAVAYGNNYRNNMAGYDFIIVHESAHEWWGNSISAKSKNELWIHEAFATYSESLLLECLKGKEVALDYLISQRAKIRNKSPMFSANGEGDIDGTDIYYKGAWMLHTIRNVINDDKKWFEILCDFSKSYSHKVVSTEELITFFNKKSNENLTPIFNHYLQKTTLPEFQYSVSKSKDNSMIISYRWGGNVEENFKMPVWIEVGNRKILLKTKSKNKIKKYRILGVNTLDIVKVMTQLQYLNVVQVAY